MLWKALTLRCRLWLRSCVADVSVERWTQGPPRCLTGDGSEGARID
jgi:hypothetical protein